MLACNLACAKAPQSDAAARSAEPLASAALSDELDDAPAVEGGRGDLPAPSAALGSALPPADASEAGACPASGDSSRIGVVISPLRAVVGAPVRILAATLAGTEPMAIRVETTHGQEVAAELVYRGGTPAMAVARLTPTRAGDLRVVIGRQKKSLRCATIHVYASRGKPEPRAAPDDSVWPVTRAWSGAEEALYSAWILEMFHAGRGEELAFGRLDEVTASARNLLVDHFGWAEDTSKANGLTLKPDCADTPYFLRAYFAWKRALPFVYRHCSSGDEGGPPKCDELHSVLDVPDRPKKLPTDWNEVAQVARFFARSLTEVHTGNGRVPFDDEENDFYGVELTRRGLRPGVIFADPYGHVLSLIEFVEPEGLQPGVLYAVDGQPDGSITRKRFWEGTFLWNSDPAFGGTGFKAFRPLATKLVDGGRTVESVTDREIAKSPQYRGGARAQVKLDAARFYDAMDRLITPSARDPFAAQAELAQALSESARVRVTSVNNAEKHFATHPDDVIPIPERGDIFEATGPWEDFSTPSRDFRLLIALDVVRHFDDKVARQPEAFGINASDEKALQDVRTRLAADRLRLWSSDELAFSYTRTDGSPQKLTLAELMSRATALEVAYDPNDCVEYRWGAPAGSAEISTCKRRAPDDQRAKMESYRAWFRDRKRPPRSH